MEKHESKVMSNGELEVLLERSAHLDIRGVMSADLTWVLAPSEGIESTGAWSELGLSLMCPFTHTLISGPGWKRNVFARIAGVYETDESAFSAISRGVYRVR
jgi:hypothetical protein